MSITETELQDDLNKAKTEDINITNNGKNKRKLSNSFQDKVDIAKSLFGILPDSTAMEEAKEDRSQRI